MDGINFSQPVQGRFACGKILVMPVLVILIFLSAACEKTVFDYRHKYVGEMDFRVIDTRWSMSPYPAGWHSVDTAQYHGDITYGEEPGQLLITFDQGESTLVTIDRKGKVDSTYEMYGQFDDKTHLTLSLRSPQSMMGGGFYTQITGWK